jgi:hypothetical protein
MNGQNTGWTIVRSSAIGPPEGSACESAYLVRVERGASKRELIVEFADRDAVVSNGYAEEVTRGFLKDEEPPQHVVVEVSKDVRVVSGPRAGAVSEPAPDGGVLYASERRARGRRRGFS